MHHAYTGQAPHLLSCIYAPGAWRMVGLVITLSCHVWGILLHCSFILPCVGDCSSSNPAFLIMIVSVCAHLCTYIVFWLLPAKRKGSVFVYDWVLLLLCVFPFQCLVHVCSTSWSMPKTRLLLPHQRSQLHYFKTQLTSHQCGMSWCSCVSVRGHCRPVSSLPTRCYACRHFGMRRTSSSYIKGSTFTLPQERIVSQLLSNSPSPSLCVCVSLSLCISLGVTVNCFCTSRCPVLVQEYQQW